MITSKKLFVLWGIIAIILIIAFLVIWNRNRNQAKIPQEINQVIHFQRLNHTNTYSYKVVKEGMLSLSLKANVKKGNIIITFFNEENEVMLKQEGMSFTYQGNIEVKKGTITYRIQSIDSENGEYAIIGKFLDPSVTGSLPNP